MCIFQQDKFRRSLSEKLCVHCVLTLTNNEHYSKTTNEKLIDINLRSAHAATSAGVGLTLLRTIGSSMDLPPTVHTASYSKYLKVILSSATDNCEESMKHVPKDLKIEHLQMKLLFVVMASGKSGMGTTHY